ncbi:rCG36577, partial [Rattus norvegicus]
MVRLLTNLMSEINGIHVSCYTKWESLRLSDRKKNLFGVSDPFSQKNHSTLILIFLIINKRHLVSTS